MSDNKIKLNAMEFDPNRFPISEYFPDEISRLDQKDFCDVCSFSKSYIDLIHGKHTYRIEAERINDSGKVLGWILHLSKKGWITARHIRALVIAAGRFGARVDNHA